MTCNCNLPETIREPYALTCKLIKDGDVVVDVGCNSGHYLLEMKNHLKTHNINITAIGIEERMPKNMYEGFSQKGIDKICGLEYLLDRDRKIRNELDEIITSSVSHVHGIDNTADIVTCFGFSPREEDMRESFQRMCMFLKPDGKAIYDIHNNGKYMPFIATLLWRITRCGALFNQAELQRKIMTKQEAISHAEECIFNDTSRYMIVGQNCKHGVILTSSDA